MSDETPQPNQPEHPEPIVQHPIASEQHYSQVNKTQNILLLAASLAILLFIGLFGISMFKHTKSPPSPAPSTIVQPSPTTIPDPTANWKTYTDDTLKVSFKYPSTWFVTKGETLRIQNYNPTTAPGTDKFDKNQYGIEITKGLKSATNKKALKQVSTFDELKTELDKDKNADAMYIEAPAGKVIVLNEKEFEINGIQAFLREFSYSKMSEVHEKEIYLFHNGIFVRLKPMLSVQSGEMYFNQILSTFKFLDQTTDTSDWKTYTGVNFSFNYPPTMHIEGQKPQEVRWKADHTPGTFIYNAMILRSQNTPFSEVKTENTFTVYGMDKENIEPYVISILNVSSSKTIPIQGKELKSYRVGCGVGCSYHIVHFQVNTTYYELIQYIAGGGWDKEVDGTLSTFKFTQ